MKNQCFPKQRALIFFCIALLGFFEVSYAQTTLSNRPRDNKLYKKLVSICIRPLYIEDKNKPEYKNFQGLISDSNFQEKFAGLLADRFRPESVNSSETGATIPILSGEAYQDGSFKRVNLASISECVNVANAMAEAAGGNGEVQLQQGIDQLTATQALTNEVKQLRLRIEEDLFNLLKSK